MKTPARPRYAARTRHIEAGPYSLQIQNQEDGSLSVAVLHISAGGGVQTIAYLAGLPDAGPGEALFSAHDAYDATNRVRIARGGGRA